ncbi:hypothetical protein HPB50_029292 [Hyalomma asiaticum]|nr:hypothetical protein HPB50_029292 [Hyalomma asiaticum]
MHGAMTALLRTSTRSSNVAPHRILNLLEALTGPYSTGSNKSGRQNAAACDSGLTHCWVQKEESVKLRRIRAETCFCANSSSVKSNEDCSDARDVASRDSLSGTRFPRRELHVQLADRILAPRAAGIQLPGPALPMVRLIPPRASPAMDPSTGAIPRRPRKRKVKAKLTFGSTSTGNSSLPCHLQASLKDIITLLETAQKGEEEEHQSNITIKETDETGQTKASAVGAKCGAESVHSTNPPWSRKVRQPRLKDRRSATWRKRRARYDKASLKDIITLLETAQKGEEEEHQSNITIKETDETGQTKASAVGAKCGAESVHSTNPPWSRKPTLEMHGAMTALLRTSTRSSNVAPHHILNLLEALTGPYSTGSKKSGRQNAAACDSGLPVNVPASRRVDLLPDPPSRENIQEDNMC